MTAPQPFADPFFTSAGLMLCLGPRALSDFKHSPAYFGGWCLACRRDHKREQNREARRTGICINHPCTRPLSSLKSLLCRECAKAGDYWRS